MAAAVPDVTAESSANSSFITPTADDISSSISSTKAPVEFQWSDETEAPDSFKDDDKLPCVARIEACGDSSESKLLPGLKLYANQPLLLFRQVKKRQARARTIYHDKGGAYFEVGQTILIPDDYTGELHSIMAVWKAFDIDQRRCRSILDTATHVTCGFFTAGGLTLARVCVCVCVCVCLQLCVCNDESFQFS